jgi:hypothetical protein
MSVNLGKATEEAVEAASLYSQAQLDSIKLRVAKAITLWSARLISGFVGLLSMVLVLFFFGLAAAMYLQHQMSPEVAYLLVAAAYAVISSLFIIFRKKLIEPFVLRSTLTEMFDES